MATNNKKLGEIVIISEELLKLYGGVSKNLSVDKIYPFTILAQGFYIEDILGRALLSELQEQIENDSLTEPNKALILKIAPVLSLYSEYLALRSLTYSVTEKSVTREHSENSETISERELGEFILDIKNRAEMAEVLLIKYLCNCRDLYPLWRPLNPCHCEQYLPTDGNAENTYHNLVYFPEKKNDCDCGCNQDIWIKKF